MVAKHNRDYSVFFAAGLLLMVASMHCCAETTQAMQSSSQHVWVNTTWCSFPPTVACTTAAATLGWDAVSKDACTKWGAVNGFIFLSVVAGEPATTAYDTAAICSVRRVSDGVIGTVGLPVMARGAGIYTCPPEQNWTLLGATCTRPDPRKEAGPICPSSSNPIALGTGNKWLSEVDVGDGRAPGFIRTYNSAPGTMPSAFGKAWRGTYSQFIGLGYASAVWLYRADGKSYKYL
jgi:hypothetical protein